MKRNVAFKLTLYFSAALLLFALIIGGVFITLFRKHVIEMNQTELQQRASSIAETLSGVIGTEQGGPGGPGGYGSQGGAGGQSGTSGYLRFLDDIAMSDVWIVDENLDLITGRMASMQYSYADLPENAEEVVKEVFQGNTTFSQDFSPLLDTPSLTVGTPILSNGQVVGALLLHSPVEGIEEATAQGIRILAVSMVTALLLSVLLSVLLALSFTKPLKRMKNSTALLAAGDYSAKTGVRQTDEIGQLAEAIDLLSDRLAGARQEREELDRLRRDFLANVSHELKTPVTVLCGSLEALCDEVVTEPEQVKSYHRQMLRESMFLKRLVNDLLDLSRLQNMDFKMEMQEMNLCDLLRDCVRSAGQMARGKKIEISLTLDREILAVSGDYGRLRQMLLVILDNAVKFSPEGRPISVALKDRTVTVRDHGVGISKTDLEHIFDRFYKVSSEENKGGSGLGLAIAKQIADRHHIAVSVSSQIGEGTEFQFQF